MQTRTIVVATVFTLALAAPALADQIHLVCAGGGTANEVASSSVQGKDANGDATTHTVYSPYTVGFQDQVDVEINGETGKIRMPRTMLPTFHGGSAGLFDLKNLRISEREITASVALNFMNSPKLRLDRMTGHIAINGSVGAFSGECQPYDPTSAKRRF